MVSSEIHLLHPVLKISCAKSVGEALRAYLHIFSSVALCLNCRILYCAQGKSVRKQHDAHRCNENTPILVPVFDVPFCANQVV